MPNPPLTIQVPGKLMIAGEFAVLEPYKKLAVMAVDRFVYATIQESDTNRLTLENFDLVDQKWEFKNNSVTIDTEDGRVSFVEDAMAIAFMYLQECSIAPIPFLLTIKSELDDASGKKYGLGSSAAVVTSVITAILKRHLLQEPAAELIFKLAAISHVKTQGNGSGADVAASSFGGMLEYSSFQANWLKEEYEKANMIKDLVEKEWTFYTVKPIHSPENIHICIGWTGKPASTGKLVDKVLLLKKDNPSKFQQFLTSSEQAVGNFLKGMEEGNIPLLLEGVKQNRRALATVGKNANAEIETPLLGKLCDLAEQFGGAGKPSGAGGGDCGIAFMPSKEKATALIHAWEANGIKPLDIKVNPYGAIETENFFNKKI